MATSVGVEPISGSGRRLSALREVPSEQDYTAGFPDHVSYGSRRTRGGAPSTAVGRTCLGGVCAECLRPHITERESNDRGGALGNGAGGEDFPADDFGGGVGLR